MLQVAFVLFSVLSIGIAARNFARVRRNIFLGQEEDVAGPTGERWKNVFLVALGQKKMFKNWIPAFLHLVIYVSFVITQIELLEIFVDGAFGTHRFFAPRLGGVYTFVIGFIEVLSALTLLVTIAFILRRGVLKVARFQKPEMSGFPHRDAYLILTFELALIFAIFCMNGADAVLQQRIPEHFHSTGFLAVSGWSGPALLHNWSTNSLLALQGFGWWLHLTMVFIFLNYLPFSKHLHILLAFPTTYYSRLAPRGQMQNMPEIMHEVKNMLGLSESEAAAGTETPSFGANDVFSLSWRNVLEAYSCTECGRCTAACPANITGKKLSPRKIMMDVRDRAEEIGRKIDSGDGQLIKKDLPEKETVLTKSNFDDGKSLFNYISPEELNACTTCNACVEACPILINPLDIILKMRRYEILTTSSGPADWTPMFTSLENSGSVWQIPVDRDHWAKE